jgi:signal transduction histidine kinase/CHASE3 domain sensor protein
VGSVSRRVGAAFSVLLLLFLAVVTAQLLVGDRLQAGHARHAGRVDRIRQANESVLQNMTDAETGVRGFQLTGDPDFLDPYDSGRAGAFTSFDEAEAATRDDGVRNLLTAERRAASHWLYAYAVPIVLGGVADPDAAERNTRRGKRMFDQFRTANAAVGEAIAAEGAAVAAADRNRARLAQLLFAALDMAVVAVALLLYAVGRRQLLGPLEHIRSTLQRLAAGDRSARAEPRGPGEMRVVIGTLNHLAAQTERLLDAEHARSLRTELRQAVANELRAGPAAETTAARIVSLIGTTLRAAAVHARIVVEPGDTVVACWPPGAPSLSDHTVHDVLGGRAGTVPHIGGAVAIPLGGDADCPPGLIYLIRPDEPVWRPDERRLLAALGREIDHAVRRHRLQQRQARLITELRVLDERKDAFVATVTHELRTPLTSILGYTEMLADGDGGELSALQQRGVSALLRNARRLQETVGDLMLLDRSAGRVGACYESVDLAAIAARVLEQLTPAARAKDLELTVAAAGPAWVRGDAGQLERVLRNLLDNAIKFSTAGGRIEHRLEVRSGSAVLVLRDTGIGIPADDLPGLGTPFHRASNAMDQAVQGSGLGLAIVHNIVGEHGGTIAAQSRPGQGSTFTVTLPSAPAPQPAEAAAALLPEAAAALLPEAAAALPTA